MSGHLSRELLLQFIDSELPRQHMAHATEHLALCQQCQEQRSEMERKLSELSGFYGAQTRKASHGAGLPRVRLQQALAPSRKTPSGLGRYLPSGNLARIAVASVLVFALGLLLRTARSTSTESSTPSVAAGSVPNRFLTPGAVHSVTLSDICPSEPSDADTNNDLDPAVPGKIQTAVLEEYGIPTERSEQTYQIDYLINPQLGGTSDIRNLWPQPEQDGVWTAHQKDVLEKHLHTLVCQRTVDLAVAQREIATDWIAAYKKYVDQRVPG